MCAKTYVSTSCKYKDLSLVACRAVKFRAFRMVSQLVDLDKVQLRVFYLPVSEFTSPVRVCVNGQTAAELKGSVDEPV